MNFLWKISKTLIRSLRNQYFPVVKCVIYKYVRGGWCRWCVCTLMSSTRSSFILTSAEINHGEDISLGIRMRAMRLQCMNMLEFRWKRWVFNRWFSLIPEQHTHKGGRKRDRVGKWTRIIERERERKKGSYLHTFTVWSLLTVSITEPETRLQART